MDGTTAAPAAAPAAPAAAEAAPTPTVPEAAPTPGSSIDSPSPKADVENPLVPETSTPEPGQVETSTDGDNPFQRFQENRVETTTEWQPEQPLDPMAEEAAPSDWKDALPQKYQNDSYLGRFDSMESFLKSVENLRSLAGKKGLEKPLADDPPEAWNEYWQIFGRPESPEQYDIKDPTDSTGAKTFEFNRDQLAELQKDFFKVGMTNEQAQLAMEKFASIETARQAELSEARNKRAEKTLDSLQLEYKDRTNAIVDRSLRALEASGMYEALAEAGIAEDERVIRAGIKMSEEYSEAVVGAKGSVKSSLAELHEVENSKAFWDKHDPNHKAAVDKRNRLLKEMG